MRIATEKIGPSRDAWQKICWLGVCAVGAAIAIVLSRLDHPQLKNVTLRTIALSERLPLPLRTRLSSLLTIPLENRFQRTIPPDPSELTGVVVLGGGTQRLREAGRLARAWPHLKVFVSSAGPPAYVRKIIGAGVEPTRLIIETISTTTFENALNSARMIDAKSGDRWLLVTSAVHMPRSIGAFRHVGMQVAPWPVFDLKLSERGTLSAATREWIGLGYYWLMGRSTSLFPGPLTSRDTSKAQSSQSTARG